VKLWVLVAIALAIAAGAFTSGWQVRAWKSSHDEAQRIELEARDAHRRADQAITAAAGYEAEKAAQRPRTIIVTREVARAVQADPDCSARPLPSGLRDALTRAATGDDQPIADGAVPAASAARDADVGRPRDRLLRDAGRAGGLPGPASGAR